jgi:predicted AlkP superfamily pyrophosphatase or phosphodiesterase
VAHLNRPERRPRPAGAPRLAKLVLLALALPLSSALAFSQAAPRQSQPKLVLAISVDQMRFDYLTRFAPLWKGGFKTLLERGAVFTNARFRHAANETGPGHSVLLSGRSPRHSGIIANDWYDTLLKRPVNVVDDPTVWPLGGRGRPASPANFIGFTVGDLLKRRSPGSRVVGVSIKDRSAILMAGPRADAAYWFENEGGNYITSTYYMKEPPGWLTAWNAKRLPDRYAQTAWTRLLKDEAVYRQYAGEDAVKGEFDGEDTVFPHRHRSAPPETSFYAGLRRTPFADELTLEAALEAMAAHKLGADGDPDLLAVGFSATDSIGHTYGPDSQEILDQLLRLDRVLERLLNAVERRTGPGGMLVALSADHGVMPLIEVLKARGAEARRVNAEVLQAALGKAIAQHFPGKQLLAHVELPADVYLDLEAIKKEGLRREQVEAVVEQALLSTGYVERVYTHARLLGAPPPADPYFELVQASFFATRSAHLISVIKPHVYVSAYPGGTGHGTAHDYDRHVPIVFLGAPIAAGRYEQACGPEDIAPTLGVLLGLDYPLQDAKRVLSEMIRE